MRMSGVEHTVLEAPRREDSHATAQVTWGLHIDYTDPRGLIRPVDEAGYEVKALSELAQLCIQQSWTSISALETPGQLPKYRAWIEGQAINTTSTEPSLVGLEENLHQRIQNVLDHLVQTPVAPAARVLVDVHEGLGDIFAGRVDALDMMTDRDIHGRLYEFLDATFNTAQFLAALAHTRPNLRVLQLGAGKGSASTGILKVLGTSLHKYTFSDVSSIHFEEAKDRLKSVANLEFSVLDVGKPLDEQGYAGAQYDLVIVCDLSHLVEDLSQGLENIRSLIAPGGRLLLQELSPSAEWTTYPLGLLPQWLSRALLDDGEWQRMLQQAGFTNIQTVSDAGDCPSQLSAVFVAEPERLVSPSRTRKVTLLIPEETAADKFDTIGKQLQGQQVTYCSLADSAPTEGDIISLLDHDGNCFLDNLSPDTLSRIQVFLGSLSTDVGIFWIIPHVSKYPQYAQTQGLARVMRSELGIDFAVCETDGFDYATLRVFELFQARREVSEPASMQPDMEFAIRSGQVYVPRLYPSSIVEDQHSSKAGKNVISLTSTRPGLLSALQWEHRPVPPLGTRDVEIEVYSVGLDYRDISLATGSTELSACDDFDFGRQAVGIIRQVGDGVKSLKDGDRVMALGKGAFASFTVQQEAHCVRLPERLGLNDGALVPVAFVTAMYALRHLARLTAGQSVLVYNGSSRLGIAAVKVAQFLGATVFAAVDDHKQAELLEQDLNLPSCCILQASDPQFPGALEVDVVLNPAPGKPVGVAEFGIVIETERSGMNQALPANCSYQYVDIDRIQACKPQLIKELLSDISGVLTQDTRLSAPPKVFDASHIQDAFAHLQSWPASNVVVELQGPNTPGPSAESALRRRVTAKFDSGASYLLVGGLGGLGRSISIWMVEHGARHLVFLSRSAGHRPDDQAFVNELATMGCNVQLVQGDVADPDVVARAIQTVPETAPLKGILQMSMVLRDQAFSKTSWDDWQESTKPKILGTWNLHNATLSAGITLEFFTLFSSISGVIGQPGQASYASANAFLDAFCAYRQKAGLAASVIAFGPIDGIGVFSQNDALLRQLKDSGFYCIGGLEVLEGLAVATASGSSSSSESTAPSAFLLGFDSTLPLDSEKNRLVWRRDPRMAIYHNRRGAGSGGRASGAISGNDRLKAFVSQVRREPSILESLETVELLSHEIGVKALSLLSKVDDELNTSLSLADLGMDSLVAIEMRMWWKQTFQLDISVLEMMGKGSVEALARHAAACLKNSLE